MKQFNPFPKVNSSRGAPMGRRLAAAGGKKSELPPNRFTAYKQSIDGAATRRDFKHGLTLEEVQALPLGRQQDAIGAFIWAYGINKGVMV